MPLGRRNSWAVSYSRQVPLLHCLHGTVCFIWALVPFETYCQFWKTGTDSNPYATASRTQNCNIVVLSNDGFSNLGQVSIACPCPIFLFMNGTSTPASVSASVLFFMLSVHRAAHLRCLLTKNMKSNKTMPCTPNYNTGGKVTTIP